MSSVSINDPAASIRSHLRGIPPLTARLEPWMVELCRPEREGDGSLFDRVAEFGSPLNVLATEPFERNVGALTDVAESLGIDFRVFFARKSNKALCFVDVARRVDAGLDIASENELQQVLDRGVDGSDIICTAAIKDERLLLRCLNEHVVVAVDNRDELAVIDQLAAEQQVQPQLAIRLSGFHHNGKKLFSRFGFDIDAVDPLLTELSALTSSPAVIGLHFHLDGYSAPERVSALSACLELTERFRTHGFPMEFIDMGGGFPMSYLDRQEEWENFLREHRQALVGDREAITYRNHRLGLTVNDRHVDGVLNSYPYFQRPIRENWFRQVLETRTERGVLADRLRKSGVQLRCEPGRSLIDGCGMTVARVEFRKINADGQALIGLSMNRTQCRTSSDDFLVDPLLVPSPTAEREPVEFAGGYLVGAYCTESELLSLRRFRFPVGVQRGDLVVFPNTAGYLMHFLESRSHQWPLAKNVVCDGCQPTRCALDDIDGEALPARPSNR